MNVSIEDLQIRYVKLHFTLVIVEDGQLPKSKVSALRGGMGHALLTANCIRDEHCETCDFAEDCLVERMMYPKMKIRPDFMKTKDSEGFVIECEDTREWFQAGEELNFNLLVLEDRADDLREFMTKVIFEHGSLEAFRQAILPEADSTCCYCKDIPKTNISYFLLIAQKNGVQHD